jgi:hypothetical protein
MLNTLHVAYAGTLLVLGILSVYEKLDKLFRKRR